jgi:hypothetical protein
LVARAIYDVPFAFITPDTATGRNIDRASGKTEIVALRRHPDTFFLFPEGTLDDYEFSKTIFTFA